MMYCWFFHNWGNWIGMESQPILYRYCFKCFYKEYKPNLDKIKYINDNAVSLDEYLQYIEEQCKK